MSTQFVGILRAIKLEWDSCTDVEKKKNFKRKYDNTKSRLKMEEDSLCRWYKKLKLEAKPKPEPKSGFSIPLNEKTVSVFNQVVFI